MNQTETHLVTATSKSEMKLRSKRVLYPATRTEHFRKQPELKAVKEVVLQQV